MSRNTFCVKLTIDQQTFAKQFAPLFPLENKFYVFNALSLCFRNNTALHKILKF